MGVDLGTATVQIAADTSQLSRGIDGAKLLMLGLGAAAAGAAGAALKMAGDFQAQNTMLATSAGEQLKNLNMISAGVLKTSTDTGTSTTQLEAAMYKIESAGLHGKSALDALSAAAQGAKLENSDLGVVADAETTLMVDYASKHITATQAMNDLIATVARGKTNIQDLSASMASVLPTAAAVGASLYDTSAAMATMTAEGSPAANAATYLRQMLLALEVPGAKAVKVFQEVGLTTAQVSDEMKKSLPDTLQMITDAIGKKFPEGSANYVAALKDVAGGQKNFQAWLELTGSHLAVFKQNAEAVTQAVKTAGTSISGWSDIQQNFNLQIDRTHAQLDAMMIKVGNELMPVISQFLSQDVEPAIQHFQDWATNTTGLHDTFVALTQVTGTVIGDVETLVQDASNLFQAFQQGQPWVDALAVGIGSVGSAIGVLKVEEFAAGIFNWSTKIQGFKGAVADVATRALPDLGQALGWAATNADKTVASVAAIAPATLSASEQAQADIDALIASFAEVDAAAASTGVAIEAIGPEAEATAAVVGVAATGMSVAMGIATAGISILIGALVAGVAASALQVHAATGAMTADVKKSYDSLGNSAQDAKAKQEAAAAAVSTDGVKQSTDLASHWQASYTSTMKAADNAKAQQILDQQAVADAAEAAAARADAAWVKASQDSDLVGLMRASGWSDAQIAKYLNQDISGTSGTTLPSGRHIGAHAAGGVIGPGEYGITGERGPELLYNSGANGIGVLPAGPTSALLGGRSAGPLTLILEIDGRSFAAATVDHYAAATQQRIRLVGAQRR